MPKKKSIKQKKLCSNGHGFFKSSDCPVCPFCEKNRISGKSFFEGLSAPAKRALENAGVKTLAQLSKMSEANILKLHGMGPSSIPILRRFLKVKGLKLKA
jgi:predicted RecB family nuclease